MTLTPMQKRYRDIDRKLTPAIVNLIRASVGHTPAWAKGIGCSTSTIERIRAGKRGATRKPMGGDRRSENFRRGNGNRQRD